ncbi:type II toxin-antitoxin system HicB family antitoxin [Bradyrhizobium sp.]
MQRRLYPAVLERGAKGTFGAWFPDFPGCVAGGRSQQDTIERAETKLAQAVDALAEHDRPLPQPTPIEAIVLPKGCEFVAYFIVGVDPPDPSERVNVYLPKSLLRQVDRRATELGMSRSSFFGLAATTALRHFAAASVGFAESRSRARKTGGLRTKTTPGKKP